MKWAKEISKETKIPVSAGHEKPEKFIILDSSNTPSWKLARAPFSLHIKDWNTLDSVFMFLLLLMNLGIRIWLKNLVLIGFWRIWKGMRSCYRDWSFNSGILLKWLILFVKRGSSLVMAMEAIIISAKSNNSPFDFRFSKISAAFFDDERL